MTLQLQLSAALFLILLTLSPNKGLSQVTVYDINADDDSYVILQLKEEPGPIDSARHVQTIRSLVDQINAANSKLGYAQFAKKVASFSLVDDGKSTTFLAIRNFDDLESAVLYARDIKKEMNPAIYGRIGEPFPISHINYKRCVAENDFGSYYRIYIDSRR